MCLGYVFGIDVGFEEAWRKRVTWRAELAGEANMFLWRAEPVSASVRRNWYDAPVNRLPRTGF